MGKVSYLRAASTWLVLAIAASKTAPSFSVFSSSERPGCANGNADRTPSMLDHVQSRLSGRIGNTDHGIEIEAVKQSTCENAISYRIPAPVRSIIADKY